MVSREPLQLNPREGHPTFPNYTIFFYLKYLSFFLLKENPPERHKFSVYIKTDTNTEVAKESDDWEFGVGWAVAGAPMKSSELRRWAGNGGSRACQLLVSEIEIKRFDKGITDH